MEKKRFALEYRMLGEHGINFDPYLDEEGNYRLLGDMTVRGHCHTVMLVFDKNHPYVPIKVYVENPRLPKSRHVFDDGSICYTHSDEWSPSCTALDVILTTMRFLDDFYSGKMEDYAPPVREYKPYQEPTLTPKNMLRELWEGIFK